MDISVRVDTRGRSAGFGGRLMQRLSQAVREAAADVEARAKIEILAGRKSGRVYIRRGAAHQASAPGEAPATDVGNLAGSIQHRPVSRLEAEVAAAAEYAAVLELGGARVEPRPYLRPALEAAAPGFEQAVRDAVNGAA